MNRYHRHIILSEIGEAGQKKLLASKVLVIGAGGLGCPALQYLVAAGIGTIGIVDDDIVEESNLQRQVLYGTSSLGKNKAIAAKERLQDLNPEITLMAITERFTETNAMSLGKEYDVIVDCTDNYKSRYIINDTALMVDKPVVFGAIFKFEGQISVFNYQGGPSYRCLFPEIPSSDQTPNCADIGVLGVLPGIIGCMQANEVLKIVLQLENVLSGKMGCYNALTNQLYYISISPNLQVIQEIKNKGFQRPNVEVPFPEITYLQLTLEQAFEIKNVCWVDVREKGEQPIIQVKNLIQIPLSQIQNEEITIKDDEKSYVLFCQSGMRSRKAAEFLKARKTKNIFYIKETASSLKKLLDTTEVYEKDY